MNARLLQQAARKASRPLRGISNTSPILSLRTQQRAFSFLQTAARNIQGTHPHLRPSLTTSPTIKPASSRAMSTSESGVTEETLTQTLQQSDLTPLHVSIQDISGGCGQSFSAVIVSDKFVGKSTLQRHRLVNGVLREEIKAIHAWTPRCLSAEQWEKEQAKASS